MATETTIAPARVGSTSQVRIHLKTRSPDIELPPDTGPILIPTGNGSDHLSNYCG